MLSGNTPSPDNIKKRQNRGTIKIYTNENRNSKIFQ
jgi:hypothetical protein